MNIKAHQLRTMETFNPSDVAHLNGPHLELTPTMREAIKRQWSALGEPDSINLSNGQLNVYFNWGTYTAERWVNLTHIPDDWKPLMGKRFKV